MVSWSLGVPAFFMTLWTIYLGGASVLLASGIVLYKRWEGSCKVIPLALYMLSVAVCVALIGESLGDVPYDIRNKVVLGTSLQAAAEITYLVVSFIFLILSLVYLRGYRGPGRRILQIGSTVLVVIQCLGFIAIVLGLPGMPLCC